MRHTWREAASFNRCVRLLLINQFGINLGFFMLMPYLANHLSSGLGMAAWTVGLVLGVRTFSQQGMFVVGGLLADRFGNKPMIVFGCALRAVGFTLLGVVNDLPMLLAASVATGLAGALFNPAVRAYVAMETGERRVEAFALFNVFYQAGILIGPLVGLVLVVADFRTVSLTAAAMFLLLTVMQARLLPSRSDGATPLPGTEERAGLRSGWRQTIGNRGFVWFSLAMVGSYILSSQIYLALPLQAWRALGPEHGNLGVSALFVLSAVIAVIGQIRITAWAKRRWSSSRATIVGLALMGAAFIPLASTSHLSAASSQASAPSAVVTIIPTLVTTVLLTLGTVIAYPFEMDTIVALSGNRLVATHYGLYNTFAGIGITVGNLGTGVIWGVSEKWDTPALPWVALTLTGAVCTLAVAALAWSGRLTTRPEAAAPTPSADLVTSIRGSQKR